MTFRRSDKRNFDAIIVWALLALFVITSLPYLGQFPKVWMDEAWDSTTAYTLQKDGMLRNLTLVSASRGNQDIHFLQPRILSNIFMAPMFSLFGVGSVQGRMASVLVGALAVVGVYFLSRRIGNTVFATVCAVFFVFDNLFFVVTRTIRPEIYVTAIAVWALYLILDLNTSSWKPFLCGVLLGISLYAHPNSFLVLVAIFIIAFSQVKGAQYRRTILPLVLGVIVGVLPYAAYIGYQDGANRLHDFWLQIHDRAELFTNTQTFLSSAVVAELERYNSYIFFPYRLMVFLSQIAAIGYALYKRRDRFNHSFLVFIFVQVFLFPILISAKTPRYLTVLMPVVAILVVRMIWEMAGWSYEIALPAILSSVKTLNRSVLASIALALIIFVNQAGGDVWAVWQSRDCSFAPFISQVRGFVPAGAKVWGPMTYWFGFYDYPYRTEMTINTYDEMSQFRPEYVILYDNSELWGGQTGVTKRYDPVYDVNAPIRAMLIQLVDKQGVLAGSVPNSCYGNIEIYKLKWG